MDGPKCLFCGDVPTRSNRCDLKGKSKEAEIFKTALDSYLDSRYEDISLENILAGIQDTTAYMCRKCGYALRDIARHKDQLNTIDQRLSAFSFPVSRRRPPPSSTVAPLPKRQKSTQVRHKIVITIS